MSNLVNELDPDGEENAIFSVAQGSATTGWVCVQDSPREEWWLMRKGATDPFVHPSPSSGDVSMDYHFVEARNTGTTPEPFADPAAFKAWVVSRTGIPQGQWDLAVHAIS